MSKYVSLEYLTQNNPNPEGIQFKGVFGNRSIGKTHGLLKYLHKKRRNNEAFMILRRKNDELKFDTFCKKYGGAFDVEWNVEGNMIVENHDETIAYFGALSLAEKGKHLNFDSPYVTDIIVDEVYAQKPNKDEFQELETWISTLSRRTGHPFHPITVWLLGNYDYGYSPILEALGVYPFNGTKQKTSNGVYLFSQMDSPENVVNVKSPLIREFKINKDNIPLLEWTHLKQHFAMYDMGTHVYIAKIERATQPYDHSIREKIVRAAVRKVGIPRAYVQDYDCMRFVDHPALKYTI